MLRNQEKLPRLPLPALENLKELLNWVKPIVDDEEFQESQESLNQFLMPNGDGEKLQKKLLEISEQLSTSWLEPLWKDMYLEYREKLVSNMNYYAILENADLKSLYTVSTLGAKFIYELMRAYIEISSNSYGPEFTKNQPLCMDQYNDIFKSVRVPLLKKDIYKTYLFTKQNHVVVFYNNNLFKVETSDSDGNILPVYIIASNIQSIIDENIEDRHYNIGSLTTANRDDASRLYAEIELDSINKNSLDIINTAVFVLCIDPCKKSLEDLQEMMLLSNGKNRYFDKSCQIIISENLDIGFNNEHTGADATPWFSVINQAFDKIIEDGNIYIDQVDTALPEELKWNLSEDIKSKLKDQLIQHQKFTQNIYVSNLKFNSFGKKFIKGLAVSPDAFFQIALQLAQYKTFGKLKSTYESVSMRHFKNGRTECARSVNDDVTRLAIEISSNNISKDIIKDLFLKAQNSHVKRIKNCQEGFGIERHLFALYKIYEKYGNELGIQNKPKLYDSPGYKRLKHDFISTSGVGFESISIFGFGPLVEDGYGIGYVINKEKINVSLASKIENKDKGKALLENLNDSFLLLKSILIL